VEGIWKVRLFLVRYLHLTSSKGPRRVVSLLQPQGPFLHFAVDSGDGVRGRFHMSFLLRELESRKCGKEPAGRRLLPRTLPDAGRGILGREMGGERDDVK
jgi:hypothetical protein